jgi:hypothetical protein
MKLSKIIFISVCTFGAIGCGPSPESLAKKHCEVYKKYNEAVKKNDQVQILIFADSLDRMNKKVIEDHKTNADWLNTYALERDACVLEVMKDGQK